MPRALRARAVWLALPLLGCIGCARTGLDFELTSAVTVTPSDGGAVADASTPTPPPTPTPDASQDFRPCSFSGATQVAAAGGEIDNLALDDASVYWTSFDDGQVYKAPKSGGGPVVDLASSGASPEGITVSGGYVYWTDFNANTVSRVPAGGGTAEVLASAQDGADSVIVDGDYVYWTSYRGLAVSRCPIDGGTVEILDRGNGPYVDVVTDGPHVFWSSMAGTVTSFTVATKTTAVVGRPVTQGSIWSLATDGTNLYWSELFSENRAQIVAAPIAGGAAHTILSVPVDPSTCPGSGEEGCETGLATDGQLVYVAVDGLGAVEAQPVSGALVQTVASSGAWLGIAVDDACVYWSTDQGAIMGAPR